MKYKHKRFIEKFGISFNYCNFLNYKEYSTNIFEIHDKKYLAGCIKLDCDRYFTVSIFLLKNGEINEKEVVFSREKIKVMPKDYNILALLSCLFEYFKWWNE